jgi:TnpA family transposase
MISEVRRAEHARLYRTLAERAGPVLRARLTELLRVPADRRVSELERLRTAPTRASGRVMVAELRRVAEIGGLGAGAVRVEPVPVVERSAARLLDGPAWQQARPRILTSLELEVEPAGHLAELAGALEGAYARVLDGLGANTAVQFVGGRLQLEKLGAAEEPSLMKELRSLLDDMLPRLDFPELLLEVFDRTGLPADFTHISGADPSMEDFGVSLAALIVAEACNVGLVPIEKPNVPALTRARLLQVDQGYLRGETIAAANTRQIAAQAELDIVRCWGGGHIASADGLRFVVPVQNLHAGHNPIYFARQRGATWLNVVNDQVMGIGGLVVPGTLRDSLFILDAIHNLDGGPKPDTVVTDTASYSDIVSGLFAICGYQFSPRIADLADTRLWRTNTRAVYGPLEHMSRHTIRLDKIRAHWGDMLQEARHRLARKIAFGNRGQLRQRYREGLEDQLGSLGLALNAVIWWNSLYLDAAVKHLREQGFPVTDEMCARLSPIQYDHINFLGRYAFSRADVAGGLRPFHDGAHESS